MLVHENSRGVDRVRRAIGLDFVTCQFALLCFVVWPVQISAQRFEPGAASAVPRQKPNQERCRQGDNKIHSAKEVSELPEHFRKWLTEDVVYIIRPEEECAFLQLSSDREREQFVSLFWLRRDPQPDSLENAFEQEHYRRIVFANKEFGTSIPDGKPAVAVPISLLDLPTELNSTRVWGHRNSRLEPMRTGRSASHGRNGYTDTLKAWAKISS